MPIAARVLEELVRIRAELGPGRAARKVELLRLLDRMSLPGPASILRLHEAACFMRAYPDDAAVLEEVERLLERFPRRADLRRHRGKLVDSGIAGTDITYPFFFPTMRWLVARWPGQLRVDWPRVRRKDELLRLLPLLLLYPETVATDEYAYSARDWCAMLRGPDETDAAFLLRRFDALPVDDTLKEKLWDGLGLGMRLRPGPTTPSRTRARAPGVVVAFQRAPLRSGRPDVVRAVAARPVASRLLGPAEGQRYIDLAQEAMVTRDRDLDVFTWGSRDDVRLVDHGDGLQFACIGFLPERRLLLESVYGVLTLKNGVPIGYVLLGALFSSVEIAYNVFETWRGGESGFVYGRVLALARHLFGADAFMVPPYQLGHHNPEGLKSGAWWFYQKLGFRAKDGAVLRLMDAELRRMKARPGHRSSVRTLGELASANVYFHIGAEREDVMGEIALGDVGLRMAELVASRCGSARERGEREMSAEAQALLHVPDLRRWGAGERLAWRRWAPLVLLLPGVRGWSRAERRALVEVVRAKGGRRETDYVARFDAHAKLRAGVLALATPS
jgi:hypothetical protein